MKRFLHQYGAIVAILAVIAVLVTVGIVRKVGNDPHAGHDHGDASQADPATYMAADSYKIDQAADGTYTVRVRDYTGNVLFNRTNLKVEPTAAPLDDATLCVVGTNGIGMIQRWGAVCQVRTGRTSETFGGFMTAKGSNVAYLTNLTDQWHVFVRDAYDESAYLQVTTLTGAVADDKGEVVESFQLNENGELIVVYFTGAETTKAITIQMP